MFTLLSLLTWCERTYTCELRPEGMLVLLPSWTGYASEDGSSKQPVKHKKHRNQKPGFNAEWVFSIDARPTHVPSLWLIMLGVAYRFIWESWVVTCVTYVWTDSKSLNTQGSSCYILYNISTRCPLAHSSTLAMLGTLQPRHLKPVGLGVFEAKVHHEASGSLAGACTRW